MIKDIDGASIAAIVRMERQVKKRKSFLVLEGVDDIAVMRHFVEGGSCELVNGFRKQNVIDAIQLLEDDGYIGVCGIVDSDFDSILGVEIDSENVIVTNHHDLDVIIFMSPALEKYLSIVSDAGMIGSFENRKGIDVRSCVLGTAAVIGAARLAALEKGLNIYFKNCEFHKLVDPDSLEIVDDVYQYLVDRSHNPKCNVRQLKALSESILAKGIARPVLCQGHDVAEVLGIGLQKAFGGRKVAQAWGSEVEKGLRLAFDREFFLATELCQEMRRWEERNIPFQLLRAG